MSWARTGWARKLGQEAMGARLGLGAGEGNCGWPQDTLKWDKELRRVGKTGLTGQRKWAKKLGRESGD